MRRSLTSLIWAVSAAMAVIAVFMLDGSPALHGFAWILAGVAGLIAATTYFYHRLHHVRATDPAFGAATEARSEADLTDPAESVWVLDGAKIIVGTEQYENKWLSLHLHDCFNAVSIRPDEGVLVIAEGPGEGRLEELVVSLKNVIRFEKVDMRIGHRRIRKRNPLETGEDAGGVEAFSPVMVRAIIGGVSTPYYSIVDIGASPTPELVSLLRDLPNKEAGIFERKPITSAADCATIANDVTKWVRKTNRSLAQWKADEFLKGLLKRVSTSLRASRVLLAQLDLNDSLFGQGIPLSGPGVTLINAFPVNLGEQRKEVNPSEVVDRIQRYIRKTDSRDTAIAAIDSINDCLNYIDKSEGPVGDALTKMLSPRKPIDMVDPITWLSASSDICDHSGIRHLESLEAIFKREDIEIHRVKNLPFLSVLFQYSVGDKLRFGVALRDSDRVSQPLKEFLLAHELGHRAMHWRRERSEEYSDFMRALLFVDSESSVVETEADEFAMAILFPHSYLADREMIRGSLSATEVFDELVKGLDPGQLPSPKLKKAMMDRIEKHIKKYQEFKKDERPVALVSEVPHVNANELEFVLEKVKQDPDAFWVHLDANASIIAAGMKCHSLFGEEPIGKRPVDLVVEEEVEPMKRRAELRKDQRKEIYYLTVLKHERRRVIVYSYPVLSDQKYMGAVAVLKPLPGAIRAS